MPITQSIDGCMDAAIGEHGLTSAVLEANLAALDPALTSLKAAHDAGTLPLLHVHEQKQALEHARSALERLWQGARTLVFFGTGGSSLGGQAIAQLGGWFIPGDQKRDQPKRPRTRYYDNLDPRTLEATLRGLDLEQTRFVIISKSGNTPETLAQCLAALQAVTDAGLKDRIPQLFLGLSEPASNTHNALRQLFETLGVEVLDHDPGIGGRYSSLTNVGLLPALTRGLDADALLAGAGEVINALLAASHARDFGPAIAAATGIGLLKERGTNVHVFMPYCDRLERLSRWYVQLVAESLGKDGKGPTPVGALGPVDQHSQLQLYLDGPRVHYLTILRTQVQSMGPEINAELATAAGAGYLSGVSAGDLINAQQTALPQALIDAGRPVRTLDMSAPDENSMGAIMMQLMLETIFSAHLLGVDPFDQPAVEAGKILTRRNLEGSGNV